MTRLIIFIICLFVLSKIVEGEKTKHYLIETDSGEEHSQGHLRGPYEVVTASQEEDVKSGNDYIINPIPFGRRG